MALSFKGLPIILKLSHVVVILETGLVAWNSFNSEWWGIGEFVVESMCKFGVNAFK